MENSRRNNKLKGDRAEMVARKYLEDKEYYIVEQNYKNEYGEIDIIVKKDECIIFVEVKYRSTIKNGLPMEAVNKNKQQKIRNVASGYLTDNDMWGIEMRFDVIDIVGVENEITHIQYAF